MYLDTYCYIGPQTNVHHSSPFFAKTIAEKLAVIALASGMMQLQVGEASTVSL
jgi:hypothetical protein